MSRAIKSINNELRSFENNTDATNISNNFNLNNLNNNNLDSINLNYLETNILDKANSRKLKWELQYYEINDKNIYVIYNIYYENLLFIFSTKEMANNFMKNLSNLDVEHEQIDYLHDNPRESENLQNEFI